MEIVYDNHCKIIHYADDTMVFRSHERPDKSKPAVEKIVQKLVTYFKTHQLTKNSENTEFKIFSDPSKKASVENLHLQNKDQKVETFSSVKYLGVYLDRNFAFQNEIENILCKRATGFTVLYILQNIFPEKTKWLLLKALVFTSEYIYSIQPY